MANGPRVVPLRPRALAPDEQGALRQFVDQWRHHYRYNHDLRQWLIWAGHRWRLDRRQQVYAAVSAMCRNLAPAGASRKIRFASAVELAARAEPEFATDSSQWDANPMLLGTPGGVVNLETGVLDDGDPADLISKTVAVTPAESAHCPRWLAFLDEALERNAENIAYFKRFCGYTLTGDVREEALLFIAGKSGTGKGTSTKTIMAILRDYARPVPSIMFTDTGWRALEYYRAQMVGVRLILASEPEKGATWSDAFVNELTGGDKITGRHPTGKPFDFWATFKLWFQGEQVPDLKSVSTGLKRRINILPFEINPIEPDQNLKRALQAEWPAILRWMIDGCLEWQRIGLSPPLDVRRAVEDYFANQDVIARWIEDCCDLVPTYRSKPKDLLPSFNAWAIRNNEKTMTYNSFMPAMRRKFTVTEISGSNYVHSIGLKPNSTDGGWDIR